MRWRVRAPPPSSIPTARASPSASPPSDRRRCAARLRNRPMSVPADESGIPVDGVDPHEDILRLESEIEKLAETLEGCRKIILISKIAMAAGAVALLGLLF